MPDALEIMIMIDDDAFHENTIMEGSAINMDDEELKEFEEKSELDTFMDIDLMEEGTTDSYSEFLDRDVDELIDTMVESSIDYEGSILDAVMNTVC